MTTHVKRLIAATLLAVGVAACETPQPPITPSESTYTRVRAPVVVDGASEMADVAHVAPEFFGNDLQPFLGRFFTPPEFQAGGTAVAVISHAYWKNRFSEQPSIIGSPVVVDGTRRTIVGVATPRLQPEKPASVYVPQAGPK